MLNNPAGMRQFEQLDPQRVVPGFPAIGGVREGDVVHYITLRQVRTMLGEADGLPRLPDVAFHLYMRDERVGEAAQRVFETFRGMAF